MTRDPIRAGHYPSRGDAVKLHGDRSQRPVRCPGCGLRSCAHPRLECGGDEVEEAFIDAVLDRRIPDDVGAIGLTVGDMVTIARWLAPLVSHMVYKESD